MSSFCPFSFQLPLTFCTLIRQSIFHQFNGLMAIPNLIAVFLLSGVVVKLVKEYFAGEGAKS